MILGRNLLPALGHRLLEAARSLELFILLQKGLLPPLTGLQVEWPLALLDSSSLLALRISC